MFIVTALAIAAVVLFPPGRAVGQISAYERAQAALENRGHMPETLAAIIGSSKLKHWSRVTAVVWSPDGSVVASAGGDGCLRLWEPDSGEQIKRFKSEPTWAGGLPALTSIAFDPAGKHVAASIGTHAVRVWEIESGQETQLLKDDGAVVDVAWHPTQPLLATGGELVAKLWDLSTGKVVRTLDSQDKAFKRQFVTDSVCVAFTPDGASVVVGHPDGSLRFWNVAGGEVTRTIKAHNAAVRAMAIDAPRDRLASADQAGKVRVWRLSTGEPLCEIDAHKNYVQGIVFHPREDAIFSAGVDGAIRKWDLRSGEKLLEWAGARYGGLTSVAIHPARDLIASAGFTVRLWNSATGGPHLETAGHLGGIEALKLTPDGSRLVTAGADTTVRVWDTKTLHPLSAYEIGDSPVTSIDLTPNGKLLAAVHRYSGEVDLRYLSSGVLLKAFKTDGRNEAVAVSPDGKRLAVTYAGRGQGVLAVWDLSSDALRGRVRAHGGRPYFSHDGTQLLVAGSDQVSGKMWGLLSVWDAENLEKTFSLEGPQGLSRINASALAPDGATLALAGTSYDENEKLHHQLVFWDWPTKTTRLVVDMGEHWPDNMAMAADGESLLTTSALRGEACVWDPRDGSLRETVKLCEGGHGSIGPSAFTADSKHAAVAMGNGTIWLVRIKEPLRNVAVKTAVPPSAGEPPADPWRALIGQPAPELKADGWLFGEPTTLEALRGKWVVLYFWNGVQSEQDMPGWMDMQQRLGERAPTVIIVNPSFNGTLEDLRKFYDQSSARSWEGRSVPFRVMLEKPKPNVIPGTQIETWGATFAAYRVRRGGGFSPAFALLIGPDGTVKQQIDSGFYRPPTRELESLMGVQARVPKWETELLEQYTLPDGVTLWRFPPPYSQSREDYRFFVHFGGERTMTFQQDKVVSPAAMTTSAEAPLEFILNSVVGIESQEFSDSEQALRRTIAGDWCVRSSATLEERLRALEKVLNGELDWRVRFERVTIKRPVIVARGKWKLAALAGYEARQGIFLTIDDLPDPVSGGGGTGTLDELFANLGSRIHFRIVNEVADAPRFELRWQDRLVSHLNDIRQQTVEGKQKLDRLLFNLSRQTGLVLKVEDRDVAAWRIVGE